MSSETLTVIIAVAAVISPVITTAINVWYKNVTDKRISKEHDNERKHQEFIDSNVRIRTIFENYCRTTSEFVNTRNQSLLTEQAQSFGLVQLYVPESVLNDIQSIQDWITKIGETGTDEIEQARLLFNQVVLQINGLIQQLPKEPE